MEVFAQKLRRQWSAGRQRWIQTRDKCDGEGENDKSEPKEWIK